MTIMNSVRKIWAVQNFELNIKKSFRWWVWIVIFFNRFLKYSRTSLELVICFPITLNWDDHTNFLKIHKLRSKTKNLSSHLENNKNSKTLTLQCLKRETKCMLVSRTMKVHLEKEMATHSSVLAWRIPGTGKPGGLPSFSRWAVRRHLAHSLSQDWA